MKRILIALFVVTFFACKEEMFIRTELLLSCNIPSEFEQADLTDIKLSVKNITTGRLEEFTFEHLENQGLRIQLVEGLYNLSLESTLNYELDNIRRTDKMKGYKESVVVTGSQSEVSLDLFFFKESSDFVIAEIFFTGTLTPQGKQYHGDSYFRIYNNSDRVLYADGLVIAETKFLTTAKRNYTPDIMSEAVAVDAIYRIPGTGKDYPVEPGKSILICDNAIDHRHANVNSFDLRTADFEWYDESTNPNVSDIDNPAVTNLEKIYCYTLTIFIPHNRGSKTYILGRLGVDTKTYLSDYTYHYTYDLITQVGSFPMTGSCYKFPNDWIIDAVNLSIKAKFEWLLTSPSLDMGWSYCSQVDHDKKRYGKSVRRKVFSISSKGAKILKDTNNSSVDFDPEQPANPFYFD